MQSSTESPSQCAKIDGAARRPKGSEDGQCREGEEHKQFLLNQALRGPTTPLLGKRTGRVALVPHVGFPDLAGEVIHDATVGGQEEGGGKVEAAMHVEEQDPAGWWDALGSDGCLYYWHRRTRRVTWEERRVFRIMQTIQVLDYVRTGPRCVRRDMVLVRTLPTRPF